MACERAEEEILSYLYGELDESEAAELAAHLAGCERCAATEKRYRAVIADLDRLTDLAPPPALARKVAALAAAREARRRRRYVALRWAAAAAAVLVALVVVFAPRRTDTHKAFAKPVRVEKLPGGYEITVFSSESGAPPPGYLGERWTRQTAPGYDVATNVQFGTLGRGRRRDAGLALVRDRRRVWNLAKGDNVVRFTDVAALIDPTSARWMSDTDPERTKVVEQNYEFDLASAATILKRYVDKEISCTVATEKGLDTVKGYLASFDDSSLVLSAEPGGGETTIVERRNVREILFAKLPDGLLAKPTLVWKLRTPTPGDHKSTLMYLTGGMAWEANYVAVVGKGDTLDLKGWVTLTNRSGSTYKDARLKLIAGDVHRVHEQKLIPFQF